MIDLHRTIEGNWVSHTPFVLKLEKGINYSLEDGKHHITSEHGHFDVLKKNNESMAGDICIVFPEQKTLGRLIRPQSTSNTILLTERCDQACVMCSQPPKNKVYDYFDLYKEALLLAPEHMTIGISGGEPTLHKENLFPFLVDIFKTRPDLKIHILSNAQHFKNEDIKFLKILRDNVLWGIPIYSHLPEIHDEIVGKNGAFEGLLNGLNILFQAGSQVELRTIILQQNYETFPQISNFISRHMPACETWAIMQLEDIGYAKMNWDHIFVDTSLKFSALSNALSIATANNINARLYNFPKCTIPDEWQNLACQSISDWKNKYLETCIECSEKKACCGFFDWYKTERGYKRITAQ